MGDKLAARETRQEAGVPVMPGTEAGYCATMRCIAVADEIGFPVLVKAAAGGGGKGMRDVPAGGRLARRAGDGPARGRKRLRRRRVYLEKLLEGARHIEFQILADTHGNTHSPGRARMLDSAPPSKAGRGVAQPVRRRRPARSAWANGDPRGAKPVGYVNAGTIECLVDQDKNFYFLEMNTRLQVEHPVTELVTGIDLVKEQIRIARGRRMGHTENFLSRRAARSNAASTPKTPITTSCRRLARSPR